jgi:hypothetical protein
VSYSERLSVPLRWWVQTTMLLATVWLAFVVAMPVWVASTAAGAILALVCALFVWVGSARIAVADGVLRAGRAHISLALVGPAVPLDAEETRRVHGVDADARAYLLTRPYLKRSVQVMVLDPADPTPYWLVSTRHPDRLVSALGGGVPAGSD